MAEHTIKQRWATVESSERLSSMLGLVTHPSMQDWEIECADAHRLGEFLDLYERGDLNEDDRFALMALIVASVDDGLSTVRDQEMLKRVERHLSADFNLHKATIHYWCLWDSDESDESNVFNITPFMREFWRQHR